MKSKLLLRVVALVIVGAVPAAMGSVMDEAVRLGNDHITIDDIMDVMGSQAASTPVQVPRLSSVVDVCAGGYYTAALLSNGTAYAWGFYSERQPTRVNLDVPLTALACGDYHTLGLTADGRVYSWGIDRSGSLGRSSLHGTSAPAAPGLVEGLDGVKVVAVSAALDHSMAVTDTGDVYAWGLGASGRLGSAAGESPVPRLVAANGVSLKAVAAVCGGRRSAVIEKGTGKLYVFGVGDFGALGTGSEDAATVPVDISPALEAAGCIPKKVSLGGDHSLVLCESGAVVGFGWNGEGQLGTGNLENVLVPKVIVDKNSDGSSSSSVVDVVGSPYSNSFVLWANGTVTGCGNAQNGVLGPIEMRARTEFSPLTLLQPDVIRKVAAGYKHAAFLTSEGLLLVAGDNTFGQLGIELSE